MKSMFYRFTKPGSDEELAKVPVSTGYNILARLYLSRGGVKDPDAVTLGAAVTAVAADTAGLEVGFPDDRKLDMETLGRISLRYDVEVVDESGEPAQDEAAAEGDVDENPTATPGARS